VQKAEAKVSVSKEISDRFRPIFRCLASAFLLLHLFVVWFLGGHNKRKTFWFSDTIEIA
jgi:hypothetical protein